MDKNVHTENTFEILLSKYISVWIWSILFGALSGITYSFIGRYYEISKWGVLSLLLVMLMSIGILASIRGWLFMFQYLMSYIVPQFIHPNKENKSDDDDPSYWLRQAFLMIIIGLAMRLAIELSMLMFSILQS